MNKKIYITGCAKSGTTLVRRLFNAFEGLNVYNYQEITPKDFINSEYDVGKRFQSLFSGELPNPLITQQLEMFKEIIIIDVLRNREDVLKSDNGYVSGNRYDTCLSHRKKYGSLIDYTIIYEDLLKTPDQIQQTISKLFELNIKHKWSEYPKFVNISQEKPQTQGGIYKLRPIGAKK
tara:strand:+ start:11235 stop:11765 length:531 start_codon:yes stop_codon:yes gene_type:complete